MRTLTILSVAASVALAWAFGGCTADVNEGAFNLVECDPGGDACGPSESCVPIEEGAVSVCTAGECGGEFACADGYVCREGHCARVAEGGEEVPPDGPPPPDGSG